MSVKSKVIAGAATLALLGATATAGALTAGPARAATPSCGPNCLDLFSKQFGTFHHPAFVLDVQQQSTKAGTPIILFRTSNSDQAKDFTVANEGSVSDFYVAGLVSPQLACTTAAGSTRTRAYATRRSTRRQVRRGPTTTHSRSSTRRTVSGRHVRRGGVGGVCG